jgi:hypothetical protein
MTLAHSGRADRNTDKLGVGPGSCRLLHWRGDQDGKARKQLHCKFEQR